MLLGKQKEAYIKIFIQKVQSMRYNMYIKYKVVINQPPNGLERFLSAQKHQPMRRTSNPYCILIQ